MKKIIHYCWFGHNELSPLARKCIESWRKFFPDYEIMEWNEENFDINCCRYVREAYMAKKWAFVSDYARFKILYENGGIYFDTDVEVIKNFEKIVKKGPFMACEKIGQVAPGLGIAAPSGLKIYKEILDGYNNRNFIMPDGSYDLSTIVDYTTKLLSKYGLKEEETIQNIAGITIYPREYFCPMDYVTGKITLTANTCSIHHFNASWYTEQDRYGLKYKRKLSKIMPSKLASILGTVFSMLRYKGFVYTAKYCLNKVIIKIVEQFKNA